MEREYQPHEQRVIEERYEVETRLVKLRAFFKTDFFNGLPKIQKDLLLTQASAMDTYANILGMRIDSFRTQ